MNRKKCFNFIVSCKASCIWYQLSNLRGGVLGSVPFPLCLGKLETNSVKF